MNMNIAKVVSSWARGAVVVCVLAGLVPVVAMAQPEWKDVVLKNGRRIGLAATAPTVRYYVMDPITGDKVMKTEELEKMPVTVDGEKIYTIKEVKTNKPVSELLNYLIPHYPQAITERYKLHDVASHSDETLLAAIARQRGAIQTGGRVNTTKAAEMVIHDFRSAALGRLTLETPAQFTEWLAEGKKADAERTLRKAGDKKAKKPPQD